MKQMRSIFAVNSSWKRKTGCFLSGQAISLFGSSITQFAIVWYVTLTTSSGIMIMISSLCSFLPQILISLFAGVWADRHNRKRLIMLADASIAFSTLILAVIFMFGYQELWLLFFVSAIRSVGAGIQTPAVSAMIPQIVPQDKLMRVNGINGTIQSLTMLVSPAVSGFVLSLAGLEFAFFIDVITAAAAVGILSRIDVQKVKRDQQSSSSALGDLKTGLLYAWNHSFLRTFLIFYAILMFLITPVALLTPLMATRSFGGEIWLLTANEMIWSLGMVIGGVVIATWGGFKNRMHSIVLGTILSGLTTLAIGCAGTVLLYLGFVFFAGLTMPLINSPGMVLLQETVEQDMQGRMFSLIQIISSSVLPLGMAIFGPMADTIKIEWLLIFTGLFMTVLGFVILFSRNLREGAAPKQDSTIAS